MALQLAALASVLATTGGRLTVPIGTLFNNKDKDLKQAINAMSFAMQEHEMTNRSQEHVLKFYVDNIDTVDAYKLTKIICKQFRGSKPNTGAFAIMGTVDPESFDTLHSFANAFEMPFVTPWFPEKTGDMEESAQFAVQMQPLYHQAIVDLILYYDWKSVIYIYQSSEGLYRLQKIYENIPRDGRGVPSFYVQTARKITEAADAIEFITQLEMVDRESVNHIVLDCPDFMAKEIMVKHVQSVMLGRRNYHYLMAGLVLDEQWDSQVAEYGAINMTGLRIVQYNSQLARDVFPRFAQFNHAEQGQVKQSRTAKAALQEKISISAGGALAFDTVNLLINTFSSLVRKESRLFKERKGKGGREPVRCGDLSEVDKPTTWELGPRILQEIKDISFDGLTGRISFDEQGRRRNFTLDVLEMTVGSEPVPVGRWSDLVGLQMGAHPVLRLKKPSLTRISSQQFLMTTILEEPYMMLRKAKPCELLRGNDRYEGYCKDLADLITSLTGIRFKIKPVNDSKYGSPDKSMVGGWNGMVGELVRREADIAIAPLTINSQREQVADFTKPFMSLGISIMIKEPVKVRPGVFTFMNPLSMEIWMCVVFAYIGVSIVLFLVSRFSPYEWQIEESMSGTTVSNHFSVINSLWFALGAFMQQGIDITPRSISGRIVGGVWWFFSLILISSYTANLAAFLTVDRMVAPINSADDLARQTEIEYGALDGGSTVQFLKNSKISVYSRMWEFMSSRDHVLTSSTRDGIERVRASKGKYAFLIESSTNEYQNERMPCDTIKVGKNLDAKGYGIATAKGTGLNDIINIAVLNLTENGDLAKLKNRWWYDRSECKKEKETAAKSELSLSHVAGIFYILICGLILAMVMALVEFCYKASSESKKAKVPMSDAMKNKARLALSGGRDIDRIVLYPDSSAL